MANLSRTVIFEKLPVRQAVIKQIIPSIASQAIAIIYNLADTYFVGQLNQPPQSAAVAVSASAFLMLTAISNLFGVGGASLIARKLGLKQEEDAAKISSMCIWSGLGLSVVFSLLFALFAEPILELCGANSEVMPYALGYTKWLIVFGGPFAVLSTLMANLVRSEGSALHASLGLSMGGLLNIILDPIFVLPQFLGMGAEGAGLATGISNLASAGYFIIYLIAKKKTSVLSAKPQHLVYIKQFMGKVLSVGFPSALQFALTVVAVAAQSNFVSHYDTEAIAALGIVKKLDMLPIYFSIGVANGLLPFLAYNYAAGNDERRRKAFRFGCTIAVSFSLICVVAFEIFAPELTGFLIDDPKTVEHGAAFLRRMVLAMPLMSLCYPMIIQFQAMGKVKESLITSVLRKGVIDIPLLFIMEALGGLMGIMWVQPIVDCISLTVASILLYFVNKKEKAKAGQIKAV